MINLYSPLLNITKCVALFAFIAINTLGVWHFHPPSDVKSGISQDFALATNPQDDPDHHEDEHREHEPNSDIEHGCDLCWLQLIAKTPYLPKSTTINLQNFEENVDRQVPTLGYRSFLETLSFLVRGPPTFA